MNFVLATLFFLATAPTKKRQVDKSIFYAEANDILRPFLKLFFTGCEM